MHENFEVLDVSPALAGEWLTRNDRNYRNINQRRVRQYARDMAAGLWTLGNSLIVIDADGFVRDGQHRLWGIIESDCTVRMRVLTGVDPASNEFDHYDWNMPRSAYNALQAVGVKNASVLAAAAKAVIQYDRAPHLIWSSSNLPTKAEIQNHVGKRADTWETALQQRTSSLPASTLTALSFVVLRDSEHADQLGPFMHGLHTLENLKVHDPRSAWLRYPSNVTGQKLQQIRLHLGMIAWNDYVSGAERRMMRWSKTMLPMPQVQ